MRNTKRVVASARKKKLLPEWLSRNLIINPWCVALCTTAEMFLAEQQRLGVKPEQIRAFPEKGASVSSFEPEDFGDPTCRQTMIVAISQSEGFGPIQIAALLCHEAVHVVQRVMRTIGEREPSSEFMAYSIQGVAQDLMFEYVRQMGLDK